MSKLVLKSVFSTLLLFCFSLSSGVYGLNENRNIGFLEANYKTYLKQVRKTAAEKQIGQYWLKTEKVARKAWIRNKHKEYQQSMNLADTVLTGIDENWSEDLRRENINNRMRWLGDELKSAQRLALIEQGLLLSPGSASELNAPLSRKQDLDLRHYAFLRANMKMLSRIVSFRRNKDDVLALMTSLEDLIQAQVDTSDDLSWKRVQNELLMIKGRFLFKNLREYSQAESTYLVALEQFDSIALQRPEIRWSNSRYFIYDKVVDLYMDMIEKSDDPEEIGVFASTAIGLMSKVKQEETLENKMRAVKYQDNENLARVELRLAEIKFAANQRAESRSGFERAAALYESVSVKKYDRIALRAASEVYETLAENFEPEKAYWQKMIAVMELIKERDRLSSYEERMINANLGIANAGDAK